MGPSTNHLSRIALQLCVDGVPPHAYNGCESVKPVQSLILSLPPWLRYQVRHMLVHMIIPSRLKDQQARKYYDWSAEYEMNDLHQRGVRGVRVVLYGTTFDSPGCRELLCMQSYSAFYPCPHCVHTWQPGLRGLIYGGYRCFLHSRSPWRQRQFVFKGHRYMFRDIERRKPPVTRTDRNVAAMLTHATLKKPFCGHKGVPFLYKWLGFRWKGNFCDIMHDGKCMCERILKILVGKGSKTMYKSWGKKDIDHRDDCEVYGIFEDCLDGDIRFPWRLSKDEVKELDWLVLSMWWPHYVDKLTKDHSSFWIQSDALKKCIHKHYVLMVLLPTLLYGYVPAVHNAILKFVYAMRRLDGQCVSEFEALSLGVEPGSRVINKKLIPHLGAEVRRGLVLLEGSLPVASLNPIMHHFVHYGRQTARAGILWWFAMWGFERHNKKIKELVRNTRHTLTSLANNLRLDIATRFTSNISEDFKAKSHRCTCTLSQRVKNNGFYMLSDRERNDFCFLGIDTTNVRSFKIAHILGVQFKAGEWGHRRCGSVITTIYGRRSRYCYVTAFLQVGGKNFARVQWLSVPEYPCAPNLLVVWARVLSPEEQTRHRSVIPIDKIDPCTVAVIPHPDGIHFSMMRDRGTDRTLV